jgi:hypothetical protein
MVPDHGRENCPQYEARALDSDYRRIRLKLRERYRQSNDLPPGLLTLVEKLDEKLVRDTLAGTGKAA